MTPEDIERLGYGNESIWLQLEQEVMQDIARRIKQTGVVTRTADYQLNQIQSIMGYSDKQMKELLKETMATSDAYINKVFDEAVKTDYIDNKELYKATGTKFIPYAENAVIQTLVRTLKEQSKQEMENFSRSLGFVVNDQTGARAISLTAYYQEILDEAIVQISSGTFDSKTTLKRSVSQMTNSGLRWIDYESGHHNRVTVAARRAVTTGLSQMTQKMSEYNAKQLGTDYYEVAWHANARPTHREWHGQVWNSEQLVSVCGLGTAEGLCGANCYHVYYPFIPGISKRNWSDEWLNEQNKKDTPKTFKGKEYTGYEAIQRQRVLETRMRAQRESIQLLKDNDGDPFDILAMQSRYRGTMDEYVKFSRAMNLREQKDRIYMDGKGSVLTKTLFLKEDKLDIPNFITKKKERKLPKAFEYSSVKQKNIDIALDRLLKKGIKTGYEYTALLDNDTGNLLTGFYTDKRSNSSSFSLKSIYLIMRSSDNSLVAIHNHPNSSSFSIADIKLLCSYTSIKDLIIKCHDSTEYYISIPKSDRIYIKKNFDAFTKLVKYKRQKYIDQEFSFKEASDKVWEEIANLRKWDYGRKT